MKKFWKIILTFVCVAVIATITTLCCVYWNNIKAFFNWNQVNGAVQQETDFVQVDQGNEEKIKEYEIEIARLKETISQLNEQDDANKAEIARLQQKIVALEQEIEQLSNTVNFVFDGEVISTQTVKPSAYASEPDVNGLVSENGAFYAWTLDGENVVDVNEISIETDISFYAILLKTERTAFEMPANTSPEEIWTDGENIYISSKQSGSFVLIDGVWEPVSIRGIARFATSEIWGDGENYYISDGDTSLILDKQNRKWNLVNFNFVGTPSGFEYIEYNCFGTEDIWTDGQSIYFSYCIQHVTYTYVFDKDSKTWTYQPNLTWTGIDDFHGENIVKGKLYDSSTNDVYQRDGVWAYSNNQLYRLADDNTWVVETNPNLSFDAHEFDYWTNGEMVVVYNSHNELGTYLETKTLIYPELAS